MLSFLTLEKAKLSLKDNAYREILESCLLLPQGKAMRVAARNENGEPLPAPIDGVAFVMALLTYMAVPKRIGVAGDDAAQIGEVLAVAGARAPHDFVMLNRDASGVKVDVLLAGMLKENQRHGCTAPSAARMRGSPSRLGPCSRSCHRKWPACRKFSASFT